MLGWAANSELLVILLVLALLIWELVRTKRTIRRRREKEALGQKKGA